MKLRTIISEELPDDPVNWTQKEKNQYRFGGYRYSFRGPDYPQTAVPQVDGYYAFPKDDSVE